MEGGGGGKYRSVVDVTPLEKPYPLWSSPGGGTAGEDKELAWNEFELGLNVPGGFGAIGVAFCPEEGCEKDSPYLELVGFEMLPGKDI